MLFDFYLLFYNILLFYKKVETLYNAIKNNYLVKKTVNGLCSWKYCSLVKHYYFTDDIQ